MLLKIKASTNFPFYWALWVTNSEKCELLHNFLKPMLDNRIPPNVVPIQTQLSEQRILNWTILLKGFLSSKEIMPAIRLLNCFLLTLKFCCCYAIIVSYILCCDVKSSSFYFFFFLMYSTLQNVLSHFSDSFCLKLSCLICSTGKSCLLMNRVVLNGPLSLIYIYIYNCKDQLYSSE